MDAEKLNELIELTGPLTIKVYGRQHQHELMQAERAGHYSAFIHSFGEKLRTVWKYRSDDFETPQEAIDAIWDMWHDEKQDYNITDDE